MQNITKIHQGVFSPMRVILSIKSDSSASNVKPLKQIQQ